MNTDFIENEYTPAGKHKDRIMVEVSGGADSSLLTWLLVDEIKRNRWTTQVQPVVVRRAKANHPKGAYRAMDKIQELHGGNVLLPLIETIPDVEADGYDEGKYFNALKFDGLKEGKWQECYNGTTLMPSMEDLKENFKDQSGLGMLDKRGNDVETKTTHYKNLGNFEYSLKLPFYKITKKELAEIYKEKGLTDTLYPFTRSCESLDKELWESLEHCGKCWWCEERLWAFGRLV